MEQVKAIAAKISTARRLARKLAEEKAAVSAIRDGDSREAEMCDTFLLLTCLTRSICSISEALGYTVWLSDLKSIVQCIRRVRSQINPKMVCTPCRIRRKTELNSAEAAAAAARADALARSSKLKVTSSRSREAARLAAENKALLEVLTSVADGNPSIQAKLQAIRQRYPVGSQVRPPVSCILLLAT